MMHFLLLAPVFLFLAEDQAMASTPREDHVLTPSVTVVGSGEATAKPDMADIQVGVVTQADVASDALKANTEAMERLFRTLSGHEIAEKDIQTSQFNVAPQYQYGPNGRNPKIMGYQVTNSVHVKVRDLKALGPILDDVVHQGANQVNGVGFSVAEPAPIQDQAREKAVADARRKAELYARAAGVQLGRVLLIQEQMASVPRPLMGMAMAAERVGAVPVAAGEQLFRASIVITYRLEQAAHQP